MKYLLQFLLKNYTFFLFLILELFSVSLVISKNKYQSAAFSSIANTYGGKIFTSYSNVLSYFQLKKVNDRLWEENALLKQQLLKMHSVADSTEFHSFSPSTIINIFKPDSSKLLFDFIHAKVISNSIHRQKNYIMFNKGRKHGVKENMGIIGPNGIVGVIFETSEYYSSGISLLNIKFNVSAKLKNNNEIGTIIWDGKSARFGKLDAIENYVQIAVGDTIITSGFSHIFPEGENIGTIEEFSEIPGKSSWNIKVRFATSFSTLDWVNITRNIDYEQLKVLKAKELKD